MTDLRNKVLAELDGSSSQHPVEIEKLRKLAGDEPEPLYKLLDQLYAEHLLNRSSGMKEGRAYLIYWLTGVVNSPPPFSISSKPLNERPGVSFRLPAASIPASLKVQPNTSIISKQPQEKAMPTPSELRTTLLDLIGKQPAIKRPALIKQAIAMVPKATAKQVNKTLGNLYHAAKQIDKTGTRDETAFTIRAGSKPAAKKAPSTPKAKKATVKPSRPKKSKLAIAVVPRPAVASMPAKPNGHDKMDFAFNLGGSFSIRKNGQTILLTPNEAMDLMQFGKQQVAMINQIQGESA